MLFSTVRRPLAGSEPVTRGSVPIGGPHPQERIAVGVLLRRRPSSPGLPSLEELCAQPIRTPMSHEELASLHGADPEDVAAVEAFAEAHGLDVMGHDLAHRMVHLSGPAALLSQVFGVQLVHVAHPQGAHRTYSGPIHVPEDLAPLIVGVFGLDNRPVARPHVRVQGCPAQAYAQASSSAGQASLQPFTPPAVAGLYDFPAETTGEGQAIAILELGGGYQREDLVRYFEYLQVPMPRITNVSVAGAGNQPGQDVQADSEVALDIEVVGSVAPGAALTVYFAPNNNYNFIQALQQAIHDPRRNHSVVTISWGGPEMNWRPMDVAAMNETLHEAAVLGVTVCVSSGDFGASAENQPTDGWAHVVFPASSPFTLACGGTRVLATDGEITSEEVWHDESGATGGGVSDVFPVPPYQEQAGVSWSSVNPGNRVGRGVPDVAGNADQSSGYVIGFYGQLMPIGGTSAVAPLWAALVARLNQKLGRRLGFLHPALYQMGQSTGGFRDVVHGNNINAAWAGGYVAGPGWDPCTGWGSPNGQTLAAELASLVERSSPRPTPSPKGRKAPAPPLPGKGSRRVKARR